MFKKIKNLLNAFKEMQQYPDFPFRWKAKVAYNYAKAVVETDFCDDYDDVVEKNIKLNLEMEKLRAEVTKLKEELKNSEDTAFGLKIENERLRTQYSECARKRREQEIKREVASYLVDILRMSDDFLLKLSEPGKTNEIDVERVTEEYSDHREDVDHIGEWAVNDGICNYGGCDMSTYFIDERSARIYAALLNKAGVHRETGICNQCRGEYYRSIV